MARYDRMTVLNAMLETGLVPVFYNADLEVAKQVATACAEGGARILEFTNRGDRAVNVFTELVAWCEAELPEIIVGVGSIADAPTAALYIAAGANFVVGPLLNADIARLCNRRKVAYSPGFGSVSEISAAEELGVEIVKVFPGGQVGGPAFVKAAPPEQAEPLHEAFISGLRARECPVSHGVFGAHMLVDSTADGPVNIVLDSPPPT